MRLSPRVPRRLAVVAAAAVTALSLSPGTASAVTHAQIQGDGSTWAENAVNQWISAVQQNGLQVVFTGTGSAQGRKDYASATTDFAVSDIGYQGRDPVTDTVDASPNRPYAYIPLAAGGTSFPVHVQAGGQLVKNIRLSGETIAKIFTNKITNWNDPEITAENNGHALPATPIVPVVHSEGAGSTAQFTTWLATDYPEIWKSFSGYSTFTEYFPRQGNQIAQNGSDGVMNYVTSSAGNGTITYDEYSYPLAKQFPVVKVENAAGYFTLPTQYNVAVALTQAKINTDQSSPNYLLQDLTNVYTYNDPRTYPLSSYTYGVIPLSASDPRMPADGAAGTAKRQTLADYLGYSTCEGQGPIGPIGYSPLPVNLVQAAFDQVAKMASADPKVDVSKQTVANCHNPTYQPGQPNTNYLAQIAPQPPACDKLGAGPCGSAAGAANANPVNGQVPGGASGGSAAAAGSQAGAGSPGAGAAGAGGGASSRSAVAGGVPRSAQLSGAATSASATGSGTGAVGTADGAGTAASVDPLTGAATGGDATGAPGAAGALGASDLTITPALLSASSGAGGGDSALAAVAIALLLALIAVPPLAVRSARHRKEML